VYLQGHFIFAIIENVLGDLKMKGRLCVVSES